MFRPIVHGLLELLDLLGVLGFLLLLVHSLVELVVLFVGGLRAVLVLVLHPPLELVVLLVGVFGQHPTASSRHREPVDHPPRAQLGRVSAGKEDGWFPKWAGPLRHRGWLDSGHHHRNSAAHGTHTQ